jgi:hypothetical protein
VRYVTVKGGSSASHARAFVAASGATPLELDDAIEETSGRGLVREHGQKLAPTPRGEAWLLAIRHQAHERATRLWLGEPRANPRKRQGSFDWADDPNQLRLPDRPRVSEPEIPTPSAPPEPKPAEFRRTGARFRKGRAVIVFDPQGQLGPKALRAWAERFAESALGGVEPPFDYSGSRIPESRDLFISWANYGWHHESDKRRWREFERRYYSSWPSEKTHADALRIRWTEIARSDDDERHYGSRHGITGHSAERYEAFVRAIAELEKAPPGAEEDRALAVYWSSWLDLLETFLDRRWEPYQGAEFSKRYQKNPSAFASRSSGERFQRKARVGQLRSDIVEQRRQIKRARVERKEALHRTTAQAKTTRRRVTEAADKRRARIREETHRKIDRARSKIEELRAMQESYGRKPKGTVRRTASEQREDIERHIEADDPRLVELWRAYRGQFRGTPHEQAEKFLAWAETSEGQQAYWEIVEASEPTSAQYAAEQAAHYAAQGVA